MRRLSYAAIGVLAGIGTTFGNALVNVDVASLAGSLGLDVAQASPLPAVYVAMIATTNLVLIKARAQFGIPRTVHALILVYIAAGLAQFVVPGPASAIVVRAASGMAAATIFALSMFLDVVNQSCSFHRGKSDSAGLRRTASDMLWRRVSPPA